MIRVVLDTNVLVSALLRAGSLPEAVLNLAIGQRVQLCLSEPILAEYAEVLRRPKFEINSNKVDLVVQEVRKAGLMVQPVRRITAARDPDDNAFLECAEAAVARFLVTGNLKHFPDRWGETEIVTPRQLIELLAEADE